MKLLAGMTASYLNECEYQKRLSPKTIKAYRIDLRQFMEFAADHEMELSKETIQAYLAEMNSKYQPRTVKRKIASLRAFSTFLEDEALLIENPFKKMRIKLQVPELLPKVISLRMIEKLLETVHDKAAQGDRFALRDAAVIELLFATGVRVSELCSLKTQDANLIDGQVLIHGKGAKERIIQLTNPEVLSALKQYKDNFNPEWNEAFFLNRRESKISDQSVRLIIQKYTKMIDAPTRITPHMFRHSLATYLLEEDVDIRYIQQLLGHSTLTTTQIYTHVAGAKQRDIMMQKHPRNKFAFGHAYTGKTGLSSHI